MENEELELYIQLRDNQPYEHPIFADNFRQAFPDVKTDLLPDGKFARFFRVEKPKIGAFEVYEGVTYEWAGDFVIDVHHVRPMTEEEQAVKTLEIENMVQEEKLYRIEIINTALNSEIDENARELWLECLAAHEAWVLESVNPTTPPFPPFPVKGEDGNWIAG